MKRVNSILSHPSYIENIGKLLKAEKSRVFCRHNLQHFLDVARVAYIINLERDYKIEKEVIYAAALLHDIGRWKQYEDGSDHALVGAELSKDILIECGFQQQEVSIILQAIRKHRWDEDLTSELDKILYEGDKLSRPCVDCSEISECNRFDENTESKIHY